MKKRNRNDNPDDQMITVGFGSWYNVDKAEYEFTSLEEFAAWAQTVATDKRTRAVCAFANVVNPEDWNVNPMDDDTKNLIARAVEAYNAALND